MFDLLKDAVKTTTGLAVAVAWDTATFCTFGDRSLTLEVLTGVGEENNTEEESEQEN